MSRRRSNSQEWADEGPATDETVSLMKPGIRVGAFYGVFSEFHSQTIRLDESESFGSVVPRLRGLAPSYGYDREVA